MKKLLTILPITLIVLLAQSFQAHAASFSINIGLGDNHKQERVVVRQPVQQVYYRPYHPQYVVVQAPARHRIITRLPWRHQRVWIQGRPYFHCDGVYYTEVYGGYQVVQPPVTVASVVYR